MIRVLDSNDVGKLREIHERFFKKDFEFPDFLRGYYCAFVVTDDSTGSIICAGGVHPIAEAVMVTNQEFDVKARRDALYQMMDAILFTTGRSGFDQLHAFIHSERWERHLRKVGFRSTSGKALYINV